MVCIWQQRLLTSTGRSEDMGKCRYDLSEDCHSKDCLACVLDKIKGDVFNACSDNYHMPVYKLDCDEIFEIINKYMAEGRE